MGELGDIYDDQGHIHLNIEADFVIFCPEPGQKLMVCIFLLLFFVQLLNYVIWKNLRDCTLWDFTRIVISGH